MELCFHTAPYNFHLLVGTTAFTTPVYWQGLPLLQLPLIGGDCRSLRKLLLPYVDKKYLIFNIIIQYITDYVK